MTRLSEYLLPTEKQPPNDAEAISHKLLVRAGMIRQLGAGLWTWLPAGWRVHQKVVAIVREEMNAIGCHELLMPVLHPAEIWQRTGRDKIPELFRLQDRKGAEMLLAMTHEENVTFHMAGIVRSYRDLPKLVYQFQTKERDEPRPRAGILRTREFIMKDAYSFDRDLAGLDASYEKFIGAYDRVFERTGVEWYKVDSDVGMMGGSGAHEYMAPCAAGEDSVALAPGYAANVEIATADPRPVELPAPLDAPETVQTPQATTMAALAEQLGMPVGAMLKAFPVVADGQMHLIMLRGDHRVGETKLANLLGPDVRPAIEREITEKIGPPGFIGPVGADVPVLLDQGVSDGDYVTGANVLDEHLRGVRPGRDFSFERVDIRAVQAGDSVGGQALRIEPAIELANIFKLGTRYSEALGANFLDEDGTQKPIVMGSYGIGPARIAAAAVEQFADEAGISWPRALAPFDVELIVIGKPSTEERAAADRLYQELGEAGLAVLYDDRDVGPGVKFADAELLGVPLRLTIGRRALESGELEAQLRRGRVAHSVALADAAQAAVELWRSAA